MFMFASTVAWLFGGGIVYALIIFASLDMALFLASKLLKNTLEPPEDIWAPLLVVVGNWYHVVVYWMHLQRQLALF